MAAAMRSALARFGRRARISAPPPLRPGAVPNIEGLQCYSSERFRMADNMFLSTWSNRSRETLKTVLEADPYFWFTWFGVVIYSGYVLTDIWRTRILHEQDVKDDDEDKD